MPRASATLVLRLSLFISFAIFLTSPPPSSTTPCFFCSTGVVVTGLRLIDKIFAIFSINWRAWLYAGRAARGMPFGFGLFGLPPFFSYEERVFLRAQDGAVKG